jgi:hypothetical protein
MTFFGGNPNIAHWSVRIADENRGNDRASQQARREAVKPKRETLKAAGIKTEQYFQFRTTDTNGKATAKAKAEKEAARIEKLTGVKMQVNEGCFL